VQRLSSETASEFLSGAKRGIDRREWEETERLSIQVLTSADNLSIEDVAMATFYLGECHFRKAFESETREKFEHEMTRAAEAWKSPTGFSQKLWPLYLSQRVMGRALYARFWLCKDFESRREIIERCVALGNEAAMGISKDNKNPSADIRAELLSYLRSANELASDFQDLKGSFEQAVEIGRETLRDFNLLVVDSSLMEALCITFWFLAVRAHIIVEPDKLLELQKDATIVAERICEVSMKVRSDYAELLKLHVAGDLAWEIEGNPAEAMKLYEEGVILSEKVKDSLTLGRFYWVLMATAIWRGGTEEYAQNRRKTVESGIAYGVKALDKLRIAHDTSLISATYAYLADCYIDLARTAIASLETKRMWLRHAIDGTSKALHLESGTWASIKAIHSLNRARYYLAIFTDEHAEKVRLLNEAIGTLDEELLAVDRLQPHGWDRGVARIGKGKTLIELSEHENITARKVQLLVEAIQCIREGLEICKERNDAGHYRVIAGFCEEYGDALFRLHSLTKDPSVARSAIIAMEESSQLRTKAGQNSLLGSLAWKTARLQDIMGEFEHAAGSFARAGDNYRLAARKSLGGGDTLRDLAGYMDSWNCVEKARHQHDTKRYSMAALEYAKAYNMLQSTRNWNHLAKHYIACSLVEKGEELSRRANLGESAESFKQASENFREAKTRLEVKLENIQSSRERIELTEWSRVSGQRARYCNARALLEQARLLDIREKNEDSRMLYREASESFKQLMTDESETKNRAAMETMMLFCRAWSEMKEAETESSPQLYATAASTFLRIEKSSDDPLRTLARANSFACKALETGIRLLRTRNAHLYSRIEEHLLAAADMYAKGGFTKSVHWARATQAFFNALSNLIAARTAKDPPSKRRLYDLVGRNFDSATRLYAKAGFKGREAEARRLLLESRQEAGTEAQILTIAGSPAPLQGPLPATLLLDQPLGIERFEAPNIVGKVKITERILKLGSATSVELEITNTGKSPATLVRLEGIPPEGLEIRRESLNLPLNDGFVDLQGRRLEYSKTYSLIFMLKGNRKGVFELRPRIITLEQTGTDGVSELEPATIIVEEPRLPENLQTNTLKKISSRKLEAPPAWFETQNARQVFQHLSTEFLTDYMTKGLNLETAGWRTMMKLVTELKMPRSAFYGPEGRDGAVLSELDRRGLVERRIFSEQRGRGGAITKVRVAFDTPVVREFLKRSIVESF
jgi:hypothetical protein